MSLVSVCSVAGSPGVTTTALAIGWCWPTVTGRGVVIVDADPSGSGLLPGYLRGANPPSGGVLRLAAGSGEPSAEVVLEHCIALGGEQDRLLLLGVTAALEARALSRIWQTLVGLIPDFDTLGIDVLVDVGRIEHVLEPTALLEQAGAAVLVTRSTLAGVMTGLAGLDRLRRLRGPVRVTSALLVGEGRPYSAADVRRELGVPTLPVLAWDPRAAARIGAGEDLRRGPLARSALLRSATAAVDAVRPAALDLVGGGR